MLHDELGAHATCPRLFGVGHRVFEVEYQRVCATIETLCELALVVTRDEKERAHGLASRRCCRDCGRQGHHQNVPIPRKPSTASKSLISLLPTRSFRVSVVPPPS